VRASLVAALVSCADTPRKPRARRFLSGLSSDELQFIAEFLGACLLESAKDRCVSRAEVAERISRYREACGNLDLRQEDLEHKMILLLEFLCRSDSQRFSLPARVGQFS
jgi:hypothetical protein